MGKPGGLCALCGGPQRARAGRRAEVVAYCQVCGAGVCTRHVRFGGDRWLCARCERNGE